MFFNFYTESPQIKIIKHRFWGLLLKVRVHLEAHLSLILANTRLAIRADLLLEEVVLVLQADRLHEAEGIGRRVGLGVAELDE